MTISILEIRGIAVGIWFWYEVQSMSVVKFFGGRQVSLALVFKLQGLLYRATHRSLQVAARADFL